nr:tRNA uridine-5-carboxymethylaminomethyl(34) synthesis enzyme MnmG [Acidobacteriota bacterium]
GCQGLIAGMNAGLMALGREQVTLDRAKSYVGVLIDDLITSGVDEPYRMFTSRSEVRLLLRIDNTDQRLTPLGRQVGMVNDEQYQAFLARQERVNALHTLLEKTPLSPTSEVYETFRQTTGGTQIRETTRLATLARRPEVTIEAIAGVLRQLGHENFIEEELGVAVNDLKYAGYVKHQESTAQKMAKAAEVRIPTDFVFRGIPGLSREMSEKFSRVRPETIGQAGRIPGVTPAAIAILSMHLEIHRRG